MEQMSTAVKWECLSLWAVDGQVAVNQLSQLLPVMVTKNFSLLLQLSLTLWSQEPP
jgi:hypothetical protein